MKISLSLWLVFVLMAAGAAQANVQLPQLSAADQTAAESQPNGSYDLPIGPWEAGKLPVLSLTGAVTNAAWRLPGMGADSRDLMVQLRAGLAAQGFQPIFACATDACGGFDFRYKLGLFPEPDMHVDLGDFRYLSAVRGKGDQAKYIALMVSRIGATGFVQMMQVGPAAGAPLAIVRAPPATAPAVAPAPVAAPAEPDIAQSLTVDGRVVLEGLDFASGAAELINADVPALQALADYVQADPSARIVIVGHTDSSGDPAANVALSRARAQAVVARLVAEYGVDPAQLSADGVGAMAPLTSNQSEEGRRKNRRVEAVLASTR